jgi:type III restriction enzyme
VVSRIRQAIRTRTGESIQLPIYDTTQPEGSTRYVSFSTRKPFYDTKKSHVNRVVCDSDWERSTAKALDKHPAVRSFVKNDHLDLRIEYRYEEETRNYLPDFVVSLTKTDGSELMLILEVKGEEDNRDRAKYSFAESWVAAVNRDGKQGRWAFAVTRDPGEVNMVLEKHLE